MLEGESAMKKQSIQGDGEAGNVVNTYMVRKVLINKMTGKKKSYGYLEGKYFRLRNNTFEAGKFVGMFEKL